MVGANFGREICVHAQEFSSKGNRTNRERIVIHLAFHIFLEKVVVGDEIQFPQFRWLVDHLKVSPAPSNTTFEHHFSFPFKEPVDAHQIFRIEGHRVRHWRDGSEELVLVPFVFESQPGVENVWQGAHSIHPQLERFKALYERKGVDVVLKCFSINLTRDPFNSSEDIGGLSKMDQVGEMILVRPTWKAHIDFHHVEPEFRGDEEIDAEIHAGYPDTEEKDQWAHNHTQTHDEVREVCPWGSRIIQVFGPVVLAVLGVMGQIETASFRGKVPDPSISKMLYIYKVRRISSLPS